MMNHQAIEVGAKVGNYKLEQKLGKGSFAEVFKARDLSNKSAVALKMMDIEDLKRKNGKVQDYVRGELKAMLEFSRYKNFIKMIEEFQYKQYKVLVLEFCEGGDVRQLLKEKGSLPEAIVQNFAIQMTNGIKCMQEKKYVHRDLKPENLLLTSRDISKATLKIADFGFARQFQDGNMLESQCGTPMYMAPELIDGLNYTDKADLWSVGVILYQLLFDQLPFNGSSWAELKNNVRNDLRFPKVPTVSETCIDLLRKLLQRNPKNRISFNEFFKHPFLEEFEVIEKPIIAKAKVEDDPVDLNVAANPPPPPKSGKQRRRYVGNIAFLEVKDAHENIKRILNRSIMIARLGDSNMSWSESFHEDFSNSEIYAEERGQEMYSNYTILESFALYLEAILIFSDLFEMISTLRISMANSAPIQNIDSTELDNLNKSALIKYNDVIVKASKCKETIESESLERHEIDSIGTIIYKKSLKIGSDAIAVEAIDSDLAKKKYRVARELLLHIKEGFPVNSSDTKTLDQFISAFASRIQA